MKTTIYERLQGKPMNDLLLNLLVDTVEPVKEELTKAEIELNEVSYGYTRSEAEIVID